MPKPYIIQDNYFKKAKISGYRARSAFKLLEIQERTNIFKEGYKVLDLGAYPGSFMQVAAPLVGEKGLILGIDLQEIEPMQEPQVITYVGDIYDTLHISEIILDHTQEFDVIISDAAPNTSGINEVDHGKSMELNRQVLRIAEAYLKKGGSLVMKVFMGDEFPDFLLAIREEFGKVKCLKPKATRDRSREMYVIAQRFKK